MDKARAFVGLRPETKNPALTHAEEETGPKEEDSRDACEKRVDDVLKKFCL